MTPTDNDDQENEQNPDVFYFKPDTFLLDDPEKQKEYRETLLKKISTVPKPPEIVFLGDQLHKNMCQTIADRSPPTLTKNKLCAFFQRRQYQLQHMKYRLLCRWAHHNLTSESMENISTDATFIYGKLEFNFQQATQRYDRLKQNDYFDSIHRPSTRTKDDGYALYVEKQDMQSQSLIREDDIEVYIRGVSHKNKINKVVNKFLSRMKWLPMLKKFEIFETAIQKQFEYKNANLKRQNDIFDRVKARALKIEGQTPEQLTAVNKMLDKYYCRKYDRMFMSSNDRTIHSWKANHDEPSSLISDVHLLKVKIVDESLKHNITGDIDLDNGFSFCYQITVFFPGYFQKQVLKSQFSIYDIDEDPTLVKKRTLNNMQKIDTNIFRDLSTTKAAVPTDEAIDAEFKGVDIKVIRLRTSAYWICYVSLIPSEPDWHKKQQALLNCDNPIDNLLKSGMNFLDVSDLASVNRVLEDTANLHQEVVNKIMQRNPNDIMVTKVIQTSDGDKAVSMDTLQLMNSGNYCSNIQAHLLPTVQDEKSEVNQKNNNSKFNTMATHLLQAYNTLRYISSKDSKTRIMYTLNYFRAVQKRLALDLREFATRDRIEGHLSNPFVQSRQANQTVINQANFSQKAYEQIQKQVNHDNSFRVVRNMMVFEEKIIQELKDMATLRCYKNNGLFSNKVLETCPSFPKYHAMFGEPISRLSLDEEMDRDKNFKSISEKSIKLMGRIEHIEIDIKRQEVYIKDDFGLYIMYDCVFQDMSCLEEELIKIGSYFLHKSEVLQDPTLCTSIPTRDRLDLLQDLLSREAVFQFKKVQLVQVYMECYEHVTDPLESQKLMQVITDIMARRPRLNLQANYFLDAYDAEAECLEKQFQLIKTLVDTQITLEKTENQRLQDSLQLSYTLCNQYTKNTWKYQDAQSLLNLISDASILRHGDLTTDDKTPMSKPVIDIQKHSVESEKDNQEDVMTEQNYGEYEGQDFKTLLGLPQITLESIYLSYKQSDLNIIKLMTEHSHFIEIHEGYPEFLTRLTHRSIIQKNKMFKVNPWSQETGSLDFYETLDFATKVYSITQAVQNQLYDELQMWDVTLLTQIDTTVAELALQEFHFGIKVSEGQDLQYEGRGLVEDEQIMGNSDKMIFYAKEMVADLTAKPKHLQDSFLIAKLDLATIQLFEFPSIPLELNKYTLRKGTELVGKDYLIQSEKHAIAGISKGKSNAIHFAVEIQNLFHMNTQLQTSNIELPSLLTLYCNMMELHRIRSEIILIASECSILSQIYLQQCEFVNLKNAKLVHDESISFDPLDLNGGQFVNFIEHGPSHKETIDLAVREFDKCFLSNFNFRNPDTFKLNILTSGLEEVRGVLQYQLMQKHLLIVATRINASLLANYQRAFSELKLLETYKIAVPNNSVSYLMMLNKNMETCNQTYLKLERTKIQQNLVSYCAPLFYNIMSKKSASRASISKELSNYQTKAIQEMPNDDYCIRRAIRSYKVKLLTKFVQQTLTEVHFDAQKVHALQSCQQLRKFDRYFMFDSEKIGMGESLSVFNYETSHFRENFCVNYMPESLKKLENPSGLQTGQKPVEVKVIDENLTILDFNGIPSSQRLVTLEAYSSDELKAFKMRGPRLNHMNISPSAKDPESQLKQLLPTYTPIISYEQGEDYEEAVHYRDSNYAKLAKYYISLERLMTLDWFIQKLQLRPDEAVYVENAIISGTPFWKPDEFDVRVLKEVKPSLQNGLNLRSEQFFYDKIVKMRQKLNIATVVKSLAFSITSFINMYKKTKPEQREEFLDTYTEFRYQQIVGSLHKLVHRYYQQQNMKAVNVIRAAIVETTQVDHVRITRLQPNNYTVTNCVISPSQLVVESGNLIFGSQQHEDIVNFKRCVQPIVNEKALEPSQVTLFQSMYQHDKFRQEFTTQFAGQPHHTYFRTLDTALLNLTEEQRTYCQSFIVQQKYQVNDFMETVFNDTSLANHNKEDAYSLSQVIDAQKFLNEQTQALLLRNALISWFENSSWPQTPTQYERFESNFRQNYFWKQLEQYDQLSLSKKSQMGKIPTKSELATLRKQIDSLVSDMTLATEAQFKHRDVLVQTLRTEFAALKKKVALDHYFTIKSELHVFKNEIEKFIISESIQVLDSECTALAKCFTMQIPKIQYHIHPFQRFAATIYDQVDPNMSLDVTNKVVSVQTMLTKLKNRATEVETLTSGPALVVTIKDFNDILVEFCRDSLTFMEQTFKSRQETAWLKEQHLMQLLYQKDTQVASLEHRIQNIGVNLENIIDARLFEKGNHLIYQLDHSNRLLALVKGQMHGLENHLVQKIQSEQLEKFKRQANLVELKTKKFEDYKQAIWNAINADFAQDQERIKEQLKYKAEQAKNTEKDSKPLEMYSAGIVPVGFEHYPSCSCYKADPRFPKPTMELAEQEMLSEAEARRELSNLCKLVRTQRILYRTKEMCLMTKYQNKINTLTKQLNENGTLWQQLGAAEKRERTLKLELLHTQNLLSSAEKQITNLKEKVNKIDQERGRLINFKNAKMGLLKELETKVKNYDLSGNVDIEKLVAALRSKDDQLQEVQGIKQIFNERIAHEQHKRDTDVKSLRQKLASEQWHSKQIVEKMEQMKVELKMLEINDTSATAVWKRKCFDIFEICTALKDENQELRFKSRDIVSKGIQLAEIMQPQSELPDVSVSQRRQTVFERAKKSVVTADTDRNTRNRSLLDQPRMITARTQVMTPQVQKQDIRSILNMVDDRKLMKTQTGRRGSEQPSKVSKIQVKDPLKVKHNLVLDMTVMAAKASVTTNP